jgi:hypothetical protein
VSSDFSPLSFLLYHLFSHFLFASSRCFFNLVVAGLQWLLEMT